MSKQPNYVFDDELYHWGIPGQRWGYRRFQNEDGSLTPEGREHYGYGDERSKAKISYNTEKYKADLKSKARQDKDVRSAKEQRNRIKQAAKTERLARKEQNKLDRKQAKLDKKLSTQQTKAKDDASFKNKLVRTKRYAMSDDELSKAIDRLKLEVEYNKQYALASKPDGALARADRFFEGATGQAVTKIAVATLPAMATAATKSLVDYSLKKNDPKEIEKKDAEIDKIRAEAEKFRRPDNNQGNQGNQGNQNNQSKKESNTNKQSTKLEDSSISNKQAAKSESSSTSNKQAAKSESSSNTTKIRSSDDINRDFYNRLTNSGNKAADKLYNTAINTVKPHTSKLMSEAERGVKEGVEEIMKDLLGTSATNNTRQLRLTRGRGR